MKLKNKLLLVGIAIPTIAITPFVSACGSRGYTGSWSWDASVDYAPALQPRDLESIEADPSNKNALNNTIINYWVNDIKNNYHVYYDDFAYYKLNPSVIAEYEFYNGFIPTKISLELTDVSIEQASCTQYTGQIDNALISLNAHIEGFAEATDGQDLYQTYTVIDMQIHNIPYTLDPVSMNEQAVYFEINTTGIDELQNLWAHIVIKQNNNINDMIYDKDHQLESITYPVLPPLWENPTPINFLKAIFNPTSADSSDQTISYHFMFTHIDVQW